jgi:hypothetical protein
MENIKTSLITTAFFFTGILLPITSYAHVMVAQQGTLNVLDNGVFMVLSLPVSAFEGVDDDNDGKLSSAEFSRHHKAMSNLVHKKVILKDKKGKLTLEDMILSPVLSHQFPKSPSSQLIVMGRYSLADPLSSLEYKITLFGKGTIEKSFKITATRKKDHKKKVAKLTVTEPNVFFFK